MNCREDEETAARCPARPLRQPDAEHPGPGTWLIVITDHTGLWLSESDLDPSLWLFQGCTTLQYLDITGSTDVTDLGIQGCIFYLKPVLYTCTVQVYSTEEGCTIFWGRMKWWVKEPFFSYVFLDLKCLVFVSYFEKYSLLVSRTWCSRSPSRRRGAWTWSTRARAQTRPPSSSTPW